MTLNQKGVFQGTYSLVEHLGVTSPTKPYLTIDAKLKDPLKPKYLYFMSFDLSSTYHGGSNKITWREYYSTDLDGTSPVVYPIEKLRNYYFSRVRRYA